MDDSPVYTMEEAVKYLKLDAVGGNVGTLKTYIARGQLSYCRVGKNGFFFLRDQLDSFLNSRRRTRGKRSLTRRRKFAS